MNEFFLLGGMAVITFGIRYAMFLAAGRFEFPGPLSRALRFVPPAVLTAIIVPAVLIPAGEELRLDLGSPHLVGALLALLVGRLTGNLLAVIFSGMAGFWIWQALAGFLPF